jgi:SAM-dependent methyltransferase
VKQTPSHEHHNPELLAFIPKDAKRLVEVGCSSGALAREYKKINPDCFYIGVEIAAEYARLAQRYCDRVVELDIEAADEEFFKENAACDCWIFGDTLEHLRDPWLLLSRIRGVVPDSGCIVACIPNVQHWSVQARLSCGQFRYEESGLLDRTHLRWFTRTTIREMFEASGFRVVTGFPRTFEEPEREKVLPVIREMAKSMGFDPDKAVSDALPQQYVVRAVPSKSSPQTLNLK